MCRLQHFPSLFRESSLSCASPVCYRSCSASMSCSCLLSSAYSVEEHPSRLPQVSSKELRKPRSLSQASSTLFHSSSSLTCTRLTFQAFIRSWKLNNSVMPKELFVQVLFLQLSPTYLREFSGMLLLLMAQQLISSKTTFQIMP